MLKRLTLMGFTAQSVRETSAGARGGVAITLTPKGVKAIRETSVLEEPRLRAVLATLTPMQLRDVARGMNALAAGCALVAVERRAK